MGHFYKFVIPAQAGKRATGGEFRGTAIQFVDFTGLPPARERRNVNL
jgi:hypothetical protein